jgi:hypothetical protein
MLNGMGILSRMVDSRRYYPPAYRPSYQPVHVLAQAAPSTAFSPTPTDVPFGAIVQGTFNTAIFGAATWVGVRTGLRDRGFYSGLGWTVGILAGIGGLMSVGQTVDLIIGALSKKT